MLGIDAVLVLPFTKAFASTEPTDFVRRVLVERLHACAVVVGSNFRFGARGTGNLNMLQDLGKQFDFSAEGVDLLQLAAERCSSTYVRACLSNGDVVGAAEALGRPHRVEARVTGRLLQVAPGTALPRHGRYQGLLAAGSHAGVADVVVDRAGALVLVNPVPALDGRTAVLDFMTTADARPAA